MRSFQPRGARPGVDAELETPRALDSDEIPGVVEQFRHAATCARQAGFDGCIDSEDMLVDWIEWMQRERLIPTA